MLSSSIVTRSFPYPLPKLFKDDDYDDDDDKDDKDDYKDDDDDDDEF